MPLDSRRNRSTDTDSTTAATTRTLPLHALWRPGVGLALWWAHPDAGPDDLPREIADQLSSRRSRREAAIIGETGHRDFVRTITLGAASTVGFLDLTRPHPVSGEITWYRYLLDGVRRHVGAGAVAPGVAEIGGEPLFRWQAVPTTSWRSWMAVVSTTAPSVVADNGGSEATADLIAELVDHECRGRIAAGGPIDTHDHPAGWLVHALGPDVADLAEKRTRLRSSAGAWMQWNSTAPQDDSMVVLRLHEPDEEPEDAWRPHADADSARWRLEVCRRVSDGRIVPVVPHRLDTHELDRVTSGLATAVRAFPELSQAEPDRHTLDFLLTTPTVERLFAAGASALTDAGCPVLLPRTIAEVRPTLGLRARPVATSTGRAAQIGAAEVGEFEWRLALGDDPAASTLSDADLADLARRQGDLVRVRGVWMRAEGAALTRAAAFVVAQRAQAASDHPADLGELFNLVVDTVPVPVTSIDGLAWLDDIAAGGALRPTPITPPPSLHAELRPYQQRGLDWLAYLSANRIGGVLADDMGLGKTLQVIALLCHEKPDSTAPGTGPTLVVCPMSVVGNWEREIARFAPHLRVVVHHGVARAGGATFAALHADADVVLTTFATATRDRRLLGGHPWRRIVVDEAQHVKNVATKAAKALRALPADHRIALTGTPVENRLEDLRAVIDLVNPGLLGSASRFRARFAEPIERDRDAAAIRRLGALTRPFILRREKTDPSIITDLPEKTDITVRANLTVEQAALYRAVIDELMDALRSKQQRTIRRRNILAALTRLKQVCNHPAHYLGDGSGLLRRDRHRSGKVELLVDILTTAAAEGDRALIFTQFAAFGELLSDWLEPYLGEPIPVLHGGRTRTDRDQMVDRFQGGDGPPAMIATLKAGGTGLNLTAANHVVHVDRWWNPAVEDQATDRAYRIGQQQRVQVHRFLCVGTLEERIDEMISAKRELSRLTVSAGENWLSDLGDDELFDLFRLRDEAVSE
ncbi:DEAD/DEAH box helicase [Gordonia insulae]|uniref:RNA polymerase-associated protein RapA n=1 Tax=Gordonia insulae TaxID=2420509 RepID=A0A3G8JW11_9ACTN|nr:DEAD/DEAH box helicase [Gordonia insulae]AZG48782.1 RNA polymerase-associated protein RapA [Gordonia insulae]